MTHCHVRHEKCRGPSCTTISKIFRCTIHRCVFCDRGYLHPPSTVSHPVNHTLFNRNSMFATRHTQTLYHHLAQASPQKSQSVERVTLVPSRPIVFAMAVDFLLILGRKVISFNSAVFSCSALEAAAAAARPAPAADLPAPKRSVFIEDGIDSASACVVERCSLQTQSSTRYLGKFSCSETVMKHRQDRFAVKSRTIFGVGLNFRERTTGGMLLIK